MYRALISILFIIIMGCGKSSNESFRSPEVNIGNQKLSQCTALKINDQSFNQKTLDSIFTCLSWNESYPHLYKAISSVNEVEWNNLASSWNKNFWNNKNNFLETEKRWFEFKTSHQDVKLFAKFISSYLLNPERIKLPTIENTEVRNTWTRLIDNYDVLMSLLEILEDWKASYFLSFAEESFKGTHFIEVLTQTSNLIADIPAQKNHQYEIIQNVISNNKEEKSWLLDWANYFYKTGRPKDFRDVLFLNSAQNNLIAILPELKKILDQGLPCRDLGDKNVVLKANYVEVAENIPYQSKDESSLEILDLKLKLLGLNEYCDDLVAKNPLALHQYNIAMKTIETLEKIIIEPNHYDVLKSILIALTKQDLTLEDLLSFYSQNEINRIFLIWLNQLQDDEALEFLLKGLVVMPPATLNSLLHVSITKNLHESLKIASGNDVVLKEGWISLVDYLSINSGKISSYMKFFIPRSVLTDLIENSEQINTVYLKNIFTGNKLIASDLERFIQDENWITVIDLVLSGKVTKKTQVPNFVSKANETLNSLPYALAESPSLIQNCFWQVNLLRPQSLKVMVEQFPAACYKIQLRTNADFALRVIKDLSTLNIYTEEKISKKLLDKWKVLEKPMLHFIGDLMTEGERYSGGFDLFWKDLVRVFYSIPVQQLASKLVHTDWNKFNLPNSYSGMIPSVQSVAPLLPKIGQLYTMLQMFTFKDLNQTEIVQLKKIFNQNNFNAGRYLEFFEVLANNNQLPQLQALLVHASVKENRYLQLIINDLVAAKKPFDVVVFYEKKIETIISSPSLQKIINLTNEEIQSLQLLKMDLELLKLLSKRPYRGTSHSAFDELIILLKPFTTKTSFNWAGKSLSLLLSKVEVSAGAKLLVLFSKKNILNKVGNFLSRTFNPLEIEQLASLLRRIEGLGNLIDIDFSSIQLELDQVMSDFTSPEVKSSLLRLSSYFSIPHLHFSLLSKSIEVDFLSKLLKHVSKEDILKFYHYYFLTYGESLIRISVQANVALEEIYQ